MLLRAQTPCGDPLGGVEGGEYMGGGEGEGEGEGEGTCEAVKYCTETPPAAASVALG